MEEFSSDKIYIDDNFFLTISITETKMTIIYHICSEVKKKKIVEEAIEFSNHDSQNISNIKKSSVKSTVCVNREDYVESLEPEKYFEYKKPLDCEFNRF